MATHSRSKTETTKDREGKVLFLTWHPNNTPHWDQDKELTYCLVKKIKENEYDAVPSNWLCALNKCLFPTSATPTQQKKFAKEKVEFDESWNIIDVEIVKRDYESYERCMDDVIRKEAGRKSITSSENEERGRGKREKKRKITTSESDSDSNESSVGNETIFIPQSTETSQSQKCHHLREFVPLAASTQQSKVDECRLQKSSYHQCAFKYGSVSLVTLAHNQCAISRSIEKLASSVRSNKEETLGELKNQIKLLRCISKSSLDSVQVDSEDETDNVSECFPLKTVEEVNKIEEKLRERAFFNKLVKILMSNASKTSPVKMARSMISSMMTPALMKQFSYKGQKRRDREDKNSFSSLKLHAVVIKALKSKWGEELGCSSSVVDSIGNFFAQAGSKKN